MTAREYSRHWQGLMQVTVAAGGAGTGVLVAEVVSCRKSVRVSVSAPVTVPVPSNRTIIKRKMYMWVWDMEKYPVPTFYTR
jgi:hypothetical protein